MLLCFTLFKLNTFYLLVLLKSADPRNKNPTNYIQNIKTKLLSRSCDLIFHTPFLAKNWQFDAQNRLKNFPVLRFFGTVDVSGEKNRISDRFRDIDVFRF